VLQEDGEEDVRQQGGEEVEELQQGAQGQVRERGEQWGKGTPACGWGLQQVRGWWSTRV